MTPTTESPAATNPLEQLAARGQSVWLDYIRRNLITSGELTRLVEDDGVRGITSNPTIFEKAIAGGTDYDETLRALLAHNRHADPNDLYEALAIEDIRGATERLKPVFDKTGGNDGYVSMEVSPLLADDTTKTIIEARRLWEAVNRPNVMIKVPATPEGIPAIEQLISEGININVTLMFSLAHYEAVVQAYLRGLERCSHPASVASVASFFVSRVDTAVDRELERLAVPEALALRGKIAVANSKRVYTRFKEVFEGPAFADLVRRGARAQRVLWASTGTKNPAYSDVLYVEELIGPHTVNTMPPATLNAFRDHGVVEQRLTEGLEENVRYLESLGRVGVDLDVITETLQEEGVQAFADSFTNLMAALAEKRTALLSEQLAHQELRLGSYEASVKARLDEWGETHVCRRFWQKDPTLWAASSEPELSDRLGWLDLHETMHEQLDDLARLTGEIQQERFRFVVLLGMGGSSLAPEVFAKTFGRMGGYPPLVVLDSTHPEAVREVEERIDPSRTLFIVSSKSGTTLETLSLFRIFWDRVSQTSRLPGRQFLAITDPGTPLEELAREREFRGIIAAPPTVGGRYSALSVFGLVPAALVGVDVHRLLDRAWTMAEASSFCVSERTNPSLELGAVLGELALAGVDKVTFITSPSLGAFPAWIEQLVAESTGKDRKGIVPVAGETQRLPEFYKRDRLFVVLVLDGEETPALIARAQALEFAGHPVVYIRLAEKADLGQEMFRWVMAVATASAILRVHPFNQPDVQLAKDLARRAMNGADAGGRQGEDATIDAADRDALVAGIARWASVKDGDYVGIQAYLAPTHDTSMALERINAVLQNRLRAAVTLGYGPRYLHSTGQLHKGGPNNGLFLQLVDEPEADVSVPETDYTLGTLIRAQALGDYRALVDRSRRVLRVNLGEDVAAGLAQLEIALS